MPRVSVRLFAAVLVLAALVAPSVAWGDSGTESQLVSMTNSSRGSHGLRHYAVAGDLTSMARRWAAHMAAHRTLAHNPNYASQACCWSKLGENVGVGSSAGQVERAFMASSPHRANILSSSYTQVGIGTARSSDGRLWVDEVFRRPTSSAPRSTRTTTTTRPSVTRHAAVAHPAARPAQNVAVRHAPARVSRSAVRHPRVTTRHLAPSAWSTRLAWARAATSPAAYTDPVTGTLAYLQVMQRLTGSATG